MVYKIKVAKKMKPQEEIIARPSGLTAFLKENLKGILIVGGIIAILFIGVPVFRFYVGYIDRKAAALEFMAYSYYHGSPSLKDMSVEDRLKKALEIYQEILDKYPRSKAAPLAKYYIGNCYLELKEIDKALDTYWGFVDNYSKRGAKLLPLVYQRMGYAYILKGNKDKAIEAFNKILSLPEASNNDQALYELGNIYERSGDKAKALEYFDRIAKEFPESPLASEVQPKIKELSPTTKQEEIKK